ncbi:MAG: hypothetical protein LZF64_13240 [Nitrosomonas sp.]|nr:hypothetical protein [Nitrosomonas sp.]MCG7755815.1 hypothetical protein [Nitrosomonas sp.]UJP00119.1 MAG: hypothetical protein LZF64_13240 [Nitrosomonas sp.]UJP06700.1 MAG: hypothetical protein LZF84_06455 [Nitrosomonas sp.]
MDRYIAFILVILLSPADAQASYFNTDRPQKIMGSFLNAAEHIDEIAEFSNAFGFAPKSVDEITRYLDANVYKMLPVISIGNLLFDPETGMYRNDPYGIIDAIAMSAVRHREILFLLDEPLWTIRKACNEGKPKACRDIENRYADTLSVLRSAGRLLRQQFPGSGVMHIEAWAELVLQKQAYPDELAIMLDDAEYLGFDCYGDFYSCGSPELGYNSHIDYGTGVWNTMQALESANPIGRKLFLVPGGFLADKLFEDVETLADQLYLNAYLLNQSKEIGGLGVFLWGDMIEDGRFFTGARNIQSIVDLIALIAQFFGVGNKASP